MDDKDNGKVTEITPELQAKLDQIQANQETLMKKDKKVVPLIIAVIVLLLISAACVAVAVLTKGKNNDGNIVDQNGISEPEVVLSDVADEVVKSKIDARVDDLNLIYYDEYSTNKKGDSAISANFVFAKNGQFFDNLNLTEKEKRFIVASLLEFHDEGALESVTKADFDASVIKKYKEHLNKSDFLKEAKRISAEKFANRYYEIFGEKPESHSSVEECGANAYYSEDTGYYYFNVIGGCGGMDFRKIIIKKDAYKESDDAYYLDTTVATIYNGPNNDGKDVCAIFNSYYNLDSEEWAFNMSDDRVVKGCDPDGKTADFAKLIEKGTKFRYTFDKEFHFKKIERL